MLAANLRPSSFNSSGLRSIVRATVFISGLILAASCGQSQSPAKLWSIDLDSDSDYRSRPTMGKGNAAPPSISFLNDSQLICDFLDDSDSGYDPGNSRKRHHVLEIGVSDGKFGQKLNFQAVDTFSTSVATSDGGFIVLTDGKATKYNASFEVETSWTEVPARPDSRPSIWRMNLAPGGKVVLLYHRFDGDRKAEFFWLNTHDLKVLKSEATDWHLLIDASSKSAFTEKTPGPRGARYFLTDELFFFAGDGKYVIESLDGAVHAKGKLAGLTMDFTRSLNSPRVAFFDGHSPYAGIENYGRTPSFTANVRVIDWYTNTKVAELSLEEGPTNPSDGWKQSALALSPDGKYLAVLRLHTLTCYRLP